MVDGYTLTDRKRNSQIRETYSTQDDVRWPKMERMESTREKRKESSRLPKIARRYKPNARTPGIDHRRDGQKSGRSALR